jgi:hypothetical protein
MLAEYVRTPPPLETRGPGAKVPPWSYSDLALMRALEAALVQLVDTRRTYDRLTAPSNDHLR